VKRILVTGANGQLGTTLKQQSLGSEDQWVFCGREAIDITDSHSITSFLEKQNFDFCINCAAYTHVEGAETEIDAARALNVEAVKNLVAACNEKQITLLHISTDYVFAGTNLMSKRIQQRLSISMVKASCKASSISSKMHPLFISYERRGYTVKL